MSWHFSRALVAAYSGVNFSGGAQCAPSKLTNTPETSCYNDRTMDGWIPSQCGRTLQPSTDAHGEALLTWFRAAFPARTSAQPEKAQELPEAEAGYGLTWPASSARFDRATASWKIHPCLFPEASIPCSVTLPRWGMMRTGELLGRTMPVPCTNGTESGLWATPCATDSNPITGGNLYQTKSGTVRHMREDGRSSNRGLTAQVIWPTIRSTDGDRGGRGDLIQAVRGNENSHYKLFATPAARDAKGANSREHCAERGTGRKHMDQLANQVAHPDLAGIAATPLTTNCSGATDAPTAAEMVWQTPVADDAVDRAAGKVNSRGEPKLSAQVKLWPTPMTGAETYSAQGGIQLHQRVKQFPTPTRADGCGGPGSSGRDVGDNLRTVGNGSLNPDWVEWLMGWPVGWTRLDPITKMRWEPLGVEPEDLPRVAVGVANRAARLKCIGNGQVPQAAALAWETLTND